MTEIQLDNERAAKYVSLLRERFGRGPERLNEGRACVECGAGAEALTREHWPASR